MQGDFDKQSNKCKLRQRKHDVLGELLGQPRPSQLRTMLLAASRDRQCCWMQKNTVAVVFILQVISTIYTFIVSLCVSVFISYYSINVYILHLMKE